MHELLSDECAVACVPNCTATRSASHGADRGISAQVSFHERRERLKRFEDPDVPIFLLSDTQTRGTRGVTSQT